MVGPTTAGDLVERLLEGDPRALARAISLVENADELSLKLVSEIYPRTGGANVVGVTGAPGVGKSTLIGALVKVARRAELEVGVLSVDPTSPFSDGALLGDRVRLVDHFLDAGVFIRSMASRGTVGGLSEAALEAVLLMDAAGKEEIFVETVGAGQGDVDLLNHADTVVVALMPGSGDSVQALKAGVMEIPHIIVINKADHPLAQTMVKEVRAVLALGSPEGWRTPIVSANAVEGAGIEELWQRITEHRAHIRASGELERRRREGLANHVLALATAQLRRRLEQELRAGATLGQILDEVAGRRLDPLSAAARLVGALR